MEWRAYPTNLTVNSIKLWSHVWLAVLCLPPKNVGRKKYQKQQMQQETFHPTPSRCTSSADMSGSSCPRGAMRCFLHSAIIIHMRTSWRRICVSTWVPATWFMKRATGEIWWHSLPQANVSAFVPKRRIPEEYLPALPQSPFSQLISPPPGRSHQKNTAAISLASF